MKNLKRAVSGGIGLAAAGILGTIWVSVSRSVGDPPGATFLQLDEEERVYLAPATTPRDVLRGWAKNVTGTNSRSASSTDTHEVYEGRGMAVEIWNRQALQASYMGEKSQNVQAQEWLIGVWQDPGWPTQLWRKLKGRLVERE